MQFQLIWELAQQMLGSGGRQGEVVLPLIVGWAERLDCRPGQVSRPSCTFVPQSSHDCRSHPGPPELRLCVVAAL